MCACLVWCTLVWWLTLAVLHRRVREFEPSDAYDDWLRNMKWAKPDERHLSKLMRVGCLCFCLPCNDDVCLHGDGTHRSHARAGGV
jgi:hypothetical protein